MLNSFLLEQSLNITPLRADVGSLPFTRSGIEDLIINSLVDNVQQAQHKDEIQTGFLDLLYWTKYWIFY